MLFRSSNDTRRKYKVPLRTKLTKSMCPQSEEEKEKMSKKPYRELIGSLIYLVQLTRPDIAAAVYTCSKFLNNPGIEHWNAAKGILMYLKRTKSDALILGGGGRRISGHPTITDDIKPIGFSDSDWAGDPDDRRSTNGYVFFYGKSPICWKSKRQATVALSTAEAEYIGLSMATSEAIWLRSLITELGEPDHAPTIIFGDNQSSIAMAKNHSSRHGRAKHIDIRHHFLQNCMDNKQIEFRYCPTLKMVADILSKNVMASTIFQPLKEKIMGHRDPFEFLD